MNKRILITTVAACSALVPATAAAQPRYESAAFEASLKGTQVSTWEYYEDTREQCGSKIESFGDQTIRFASARAGRLIVGRPAGGKPTVVLTGTKPGQWEIGAEAERNGTWKSDHTGATNCDDADNGGGVEPRREDKNCGTRYGWLTPRVEATGRARITLSGSTADWADSPLGTIPVDGPGTGNTLDSTYEYCPFWSTGPYAPEAEAGVLPAPEKLPLAAMLRGKQKRLVIDFGYTKSYATGRGFKGKTIVTAKLTLRRTQLGA